jgi:hypothetical protein
MIPLLHQSLRISDRDGGIGRDFHRWLQLIVQAVSSTFIGDQAPGRSYVIKDGQFGLHGKRLTMASKERLTIEGSGRLVICG